MFSIMRKSKMKNKIDWELMAFRRAEFVLAEARCDNHFRDQTITFALRVISNWATVGKDGSSNFIKWNNTRVSESAWILYENSTDKEWESLTINEHQEPLKQVWEWIVKDKNNISATDIINRLKEWPMITITKEEDNIIVKQGNKYCGSPLERHQFIKLGRLGPPKKRNT